MRHIKLFESFDEKYVGVHCSPKSLDDDFYGKIIDEYYQAFGQVLGLIQDDYVGAKDLLDRVDSLDDGLDLYGESADLIYEIEAFFEDNNIEWIFVSIGEPMTKYGSNCYDVYFKDLGKVYVMDDELTDGAKIYIYNSKTDRPVLRGHDSDGISESASISYSIEYNFPENIRVLAKEGNQVVGTLSIIDESNIFDEEDEPVYTIMSTGVDIEHRRQGIYLGMIKHFLENNKYGAKSLYSSKHPDFDDQPRSKDADMFWSHVYRNQPKYGVRVEKTGSDFEIFLA